MKLRQVLIKDYRSVNDSTLFDVESDKTIVVGANEAGKTAVLRALRTVSPPVGEDSALNALRDYPRARYDEIATGAVDPSDVEVATALFSLDDGDLAALRAVDADVFASARTWKVTRRLDNQLRWSLPEVPSSKAVRDIEKDLARLKAHLSKQAAGAEIAASVENILTDTAASSRVRPELRQAGP